MMMFEVRESPPQKAVLPAGQVCFSVWGSLSWVSLVLVFGWS